MLAGAGSLSTDSRLDSTGTGFHAATIDKTSNATVHNTEDPSPSSAELLKRALGGLPAPEWRWCPILRGVPVT